MNIRKNIDYSEMYEELDMLMSKSLPQMELYFGIGKAVCQRPEKGAAVMASEYLNRQYTDAKGFSPRNLRRMRDFYRTYENYPALLSLAIQIGWIQNVVIMEADLTMELQEWYMKAVMQFNWSKAELIANITANAHEKFALTNEEEVYYIDDVKRTAERKENVWVPHHVKRFVFLIKMTLWQLKINRGKRRRCSTIFDIVLHSICKKETIELGQFIVYNYLYMYGVVQP